MSKVYGMGSNDADYEVSPRGGPRCPFYVVWKDMLKRCYSKKRPPTYLDCRVCPGWLRFSNFKQWMETQDWEDKQLDKDLVGNGELYSPESCAFVEQWLNNLFIERGRSRGEYPLGVCKARNKFQAQLSVDSRDTYLGVFSSPEEAHAVYLAAKKNYVIMKMSDYPDERIKQAALRKVQI